jgi:hypothetical protein
MPFGMPAAAKLQADVAAAQWSDGRQILLREGTVVAPLFPAADQDGFNGEWCCQIAEKEGKKVLIPVQFLR